MEINNSNLNSHEYLKALMAKEIHLMREVLTNMHQEETSILSDDKSGWAQAMCERAQIIQILRPLREERIHVARAVESTPAFDIDNCEILSMRDQLMALMEKINAQSILNERLTAHPSPSNLHKQMQPLQQKKKSSIATYYEGE